MKSAQLIGLLLLVLTPSGCATIFSGSTQDFTVTATVVGAEVFLNDQLLGSTPLTVKIKRGQTGTIRVVEDGYETWEVPLEKEINGVVWLNVMSLSSFGSSTDYATGAWYRYEPSSYFVGLQPSGQSTAERTEWQRRERSRAFVLLNSQALASDLAAGDGEYLDVLVDLLAVKPEDRVDALERWRAAYNASKTAPEFAMAIVEEQD